MARLTVDTQKGEEGVEALWLNGRMSREIRAWRDKVGWSATRLAKELNVSRSYVKHIESRKHPWSVRPRVELRLRELIATTKPRMQLSEPKPRLLFSRFTIPNRVRLVTKVRRCRGHADWVIFGSANQVYCNRECERIYRRRVRKAEKERG